MTLIVDDDDHHLPFNVKFNCVDCIFVKLFEPVIMK